MSAPEGWSEFDLIDRLFKPLAEGAPEALGLIDDAALVPGREGHELVITADALVEGVHFLHSDPPDMVAQKLLRVNLSDLAAKGARPYGYFLTIAWPHGQSHVGQELFAAGLAHDQRLFGLKLFGGDTVSTPGPLTLSATLLGWVTTGSMVKRSGAKTGDLLLVSGPIGDATLGLRAARGELSGLADWELDFLIHRYRVPTPRIDLHGALGQAHAAADISDGLIADAGKIAAASGLGVEIDLARLPLSPTAERWVAAEPERDQALLTLAAGGDDYEIACAAADHIPGFTAVGRFKAQAGVAVFHAGQIMSVGRMGYRHGKDG
ncbi:thiamine-phosphate kinase [soil metagenome]